MTLPEPPFTTREALLEILKSLPVGILLADRNGVITWVNDTLCSQLGAAPDELVGKKRQALPARGVLTLSRSVERFYVPSLSGKPDSWLECITQKINGNQGLAAEVGCVIDVTRYQQPSNPRTEAFELRDPGRMDLVTGLLTKKAVMQELVSQVSRSRRYHNPLTILIMRVTHCSMTGDGLYPIQTETLLQAIAKLLNEKLRWVDIAGRWDNDDILLVLPETTAKAAAKLAGKIRISIMALPFAHHLASNSAISVGIGITGWRKGDDTLQLINRASQLLTEREGHPVDPIAIG